MPGVGALVRDWRVRRRKSQLGLALEAGISARHLSFVETGRSRPSSKMVMHLAEHLDVPLRERNQLLLAAGFAPAYGQRAFDDPDLEPVRDAIEAVLRGHDPYPAIVVDRHWGLIAGNDAVALLTAGVAGHLLEPPVNVLRVSLHPGGMAPSILNLGEWRAHLLDRLARQAAATGDPALAALHGELAAYPGGEATGSTTPASSEIAVPLRLRSGAGDLAFISMVATFGTASDVTVSELAIESFFPADAATRDALGAFASTTST